MPDREQEWDVGPTMDAPDLELKLYYLLQRRGDQRYVPDDRKIRSMEALSKAFALYGGNLSRWCKENRIADASRHVPHLCRIFAIEPAWLALPFHDFEPACEGSMSWGWLGLLALAQTEDVGVISTCEAALAPQSLDRLRHARPEGVPEPTPRFLFDPGARLQVELKTPGSDRTGSNWQGWNIVLLSEDPSGYYCLVPRHAGLSSMPPSFIPPLGVVGFRTKLDKSSVSGEHAFVLVALKPPLPADLVALLCAPAEGTEFQPAIEKLAQHALPLVRAGEGGVLRLSYRVR